MLTTLWSAVPTLLLLGFWLAFGTHFITGLVVADLPQEIRDLPADSLNRIVNDIRNLGIGNIVSGKDDQTTQTAADQMFNRLVAAIK